MTMLAQPVPAVADVLRALTERVPLLSAPCRRHPDERALDEAGIAWALDMGLSAEPDRLRAARFGEMAARAFPEASRDRVEIFTRWLIWLFAFDDLRDDTPLGRDPVALDQFHGSLLARLDRPRPGCEPLAAALSELWAVTGAAATPGWRARFRSHLAEHRLACVREAENRVRGRIPTVSEYADLRRAANGTFLFDLAEPVVGVHLPDTLVAGTTWRTLVGACNDVTAWCNDLASLTKEHSHGDMRNYVTVLAASGALDEAQAAVAVAHQVTFRVAQMQAAARALPAEFARLGIDEVAGREASKVAAVYLGAPRGHLEWILASARYAVI